jgi:hypothetical protein
VASVVGVAGVGGLRVALGVVGSQRADAERPCRLLVAPCVVPGSPVLVALVGGGGAFLRALVLAGAARRGTRMTQLFFVTFVTFHFLLPFLFFSVVFCVVFIFDVYVLCSCCFVYLMCMLSVFCM